VSGFFHDPDGNIFQPNFEHFAHDPELFAPAVFNFLALSST
jgi:hypothetical protein